MDKMGRLIEQDEQGNWCLKGLPWKDTYVGQIITKNTQEKIYGALCKLKDYEDSGLDQEEAYRLKERDTEKEPEIIGVNSAIGCNIGKCPECGEILRSYMKFCDECGQRLDWSE